VVDVGYQGDGLVGVDECLFNFGQGLGVGHAGNGHPDDFAANFVEAADTSDGAVNIQGVFVDHGLDDDGMASTDGDITNLNGSGLATGQGGLGVVEGVAQRLDGIGQGLHGT
jgi:hypothetical protein